MAARDYRWLVFIYYLPPEAGSVRVRVWRRMKKLGMVSFRNSVYFLPHGEEHYEILQWLSQEIRKAGGEATLLKTEGVENLSDEEVADLFREPRSEDYRQIAEAADGIFLRLEALGSARDKGGAEIGAGGMTALVDELGAIRKRYDEVREIDFFGAPGRGDAEDAIGRCLREVRRLKEQEEPAVAADGERPLLDPADFQGKVWVTRPRLYVDRVATAWAISRYIDPGARFEFSEDPSAVKGAIPFDYVDVELGHQGEDCTFETLVRRFGLQAGPLADIAEIVHDVDLKDARYGRREAAGLEVILKGITASGDDGQILAEGMTLFDELLAGLGGEPAGTEDTSTSGSRKSATVKR